MIDSLPSGIDAAVNSCAAITLTTPSNAAIIHPLFGRGGSVVTTKPISWRLLGSGACNFNYPRELY
jgi:hypothetical protein